MITVTWFNQNSVRIVQNYKVFSKDRSQVKGGGVALYVRDDVEIYEVIDKGLANLQGEQIWCNG